MRSGPIALICVVGIRLQRGASRPRVRSQPRAGPRRAAPSATGSGLGFGHRNWFRLDRLRPARVLPPQPVRARLVPGRSNSGSTSASGSASGAGAVSASACGSSCRLRLDSRHLLDLGGLGQDGRHDDRLHLGRRHHFGFGRRLFDALSRQRLRRRLEAGSSAHDASRGSRSPRLRPAVSPALAPDPRACRRNRENRCSESRRLRGRKGSRRRPRRAPAQQSKSGRDRDRAASAALAPRPRYGGRPRPTRRRRLSARREAPSFRRYATAPPP